MTVFPLPRHSLAVICAAALAFVAATLLLAGAGAAPLQGGHLLYLPDVESSGPPSTPTPTPTPAPTAEPLAAVAGAPSRQGEPNASPLGIEGWGRSWLDLQNRTDRGVALLAALRPGTGKGVDVRLQLAPLSGARINLQKLDGIQQAFYRGVVTADGPIDARVHTVWKAGGAMAYEAPDASDRLALPLLVKTVYSHTTLFYAQNTDEGPDKNIITFDIYDPAGGPKLRSFSSRLDPGGSVSWDTFSDGILFRQLGDSFVGAMFIKAEEPVAVVAYGEEMQAAGTSAYVARRRSDAEKRQILPIVRSRAGGDTLVSVMNLTASPQTVAAVYRGAPFSPMGAGDVVRANFDIGPLGAAAIDLGPLIRGNTPAPGLPERFVGSLVLDASGPILAVAQETERRGGRVVASAAYNAFGTADTAAAFVVPRVSRGAATTTMLVFNPGDAGADYTVRFMDDTGAAVGSAAGRLEAGGLVSLKPGDAGVPGVGSPLSAIIEADTPLAVLVLDDGFMDMSDRSYSWAVSTVADAGPSPSPSASATSKPDDPTPSPPPTATTATGEVAVVYLPLARNR